MKIKPKIIGLLLIFVIAVANMNAQETEEQFGKIGIGMSFFNSTDLNFFSGDENFGSLIYVPIILNEKYKIEPELGLAISEKTDNTSVNRVAYSLGVGFFKMKRLNNLSLQYGARIGTWSLDYFHFSPTIGGEYFLSKKFSVGAEVQFKVIMTNIDNAVGYTSTSALLRYYFK